MKASVCQGLASRMEPLHAKSCRALVMGLGVYAGGAFGVPWYAGSAVGVPWLDTMGRQLRVMRALPTGTPTHAACPYQPEALVGLSRATIREKMGRPDSVGYVQAGSWTYELTSPVPPTQLGGGFPELTFVFDEKHRVARVECHYAR